MSHLCLHLEWLRRQIRLVAPPRTYPTGVQMIWDLSGRAHWDVRRKDYPTLKHYRKLLARYSECVSSFEVKTIWCEVTLDGDDTLVADERGGLRRFQRETESRLPLSRPDAERPCRVLDTSRSRERKAKANIAQTRCCRALIRVNLKYAERRNATRNRWTQKGEHESRAVLRGDWAGRSRQADERVARLRGVP